VARDWTNTDDVREDIFHRMEAFGQNIAPVPYAACLENREDGPVWVVDIHVKVRRLIEFDITAEGKHLHEALRRIYLGLNNEATYRRQSATTF
jgi:hypothetical protein